MYYLNTNVPIRLFEKVKNGLVYADKTLLLEKISERINTAGQYVCITRPRRFGKTVNASMLGAYYTKGQDSRALFKGMHIEKTAGFQIHQNKYNVVYMDFSQAPDFCSGYREYLTEILEKLKSDLLEEYPGLREKKYGSVSQMFRDTEDSFLFIMDEWDWLFSQNFVTERDQSAYLGFLRNLLKDQPYVSLAYMTGVLPIAKYSSGSELNMFQEYNFMNDQIYESFFGFTEEEVRALCQQHSAVSYEELKWWYDGYYLSCGQSLFNPRSVNLALSDGVCKSYWTETGPMNEVADCIEHNVDEVREDIVKMVAGIPVSAKLDGYSAVQRQLQDRNEILSAMVVYGFLSYHNGELKIPNHELMEKFESALNRKSMGGVRQIINCSRKMLEATLNCDESAVAQILEEVHDKEVPFLQYNDENSLSCVITLCYLSARNDYEIEREAKSGKGYCDYLFLPKQPGSPAVILELKVDGTCEEAIEQIQSRNYVQKAERYRDILLVGINYDRKTKKHTCRIVKFK